jgi:hypothetical protein
VDKVNIMAEQRPAHNKKTRDVIRHTQKEICTHTHTHAPVRRAIVIAVLKGPLR